MQSSILANFLVLRSPIKVAFFLILDDTPHHLRNAHHPSINGLLGHMLPGSNPVVLTLFSVAAWSSLLRHVAPNPWPGVLGRIDIWGVARPEHLFYALNSKVIICDSRFMWRSAIF
jgi:hypothetical protein